MENKTIGMMQKMNIKLPSPTKFDGRYPQFYEWAEKVKAYLSVHNVNIDDIMDDCTKSGTVILLGDIQDKYTADGVRECNTKFPTAPQEDEDDYDEYMDMTVNNVNATKPGSEAHSIIRRVMRQSNGGPEEATELNNFRFFAQSCNRARIATLDNLQCNTTCKCLEDINRYESENGHGPINDHVKVINLKANIAQNLMMKIHQRTTFDEVHQ
eukprot:6490407-Amphidinium_carterae.2